MSDDSDRAREEAESLIRNGMPGPGPKILGEITIKLVEAGPGQTQTTMTCSIPDELVARGLYQKGAVILEMILAQRAAQNSPQVLRAGPRPAGRIGRRTTDVRG